MRSPPRAGRLPAPAWGPATRKPSRDPQQIAYPLESASFPSAIAPPLRVLLALLLVAATAAMASASLPLETDAPAATRAATHPTSPRDTTKPLTKGEVWPVLRADTARHWRVWVPVRDTVHPADTILVELVDHGLVLARAAGQLAQPMPRALVPARFGASRQRLTDSTARWGAVEFRLDPAVPRRVPKDSLATDTMPQGWPADAPTASWQSLSGTVRRSAAAPLYILPRSAQPIYPPAKPRGSGTDRLLVVRIEERQLWWRSADSVWFRTPVAVGSDAALIDPATKRRWRFATPRGVLTVQRRDSMSLWRAPDWHYIELARKHAGRIFRAPPRGTLVTDDGRTIEIRNGQFLETAPSGRPAPLSGNEAKELVVAGAVVLPPAGSNARAYPGVLGSRRLWLGDGYAIHGTNKPSSVGQAVSHGCLRVRNPDIELLYPRIPLGTRVLIY